MHRLIATSLLLLALAPSIARADTPVFVDSLVPQVIPLSKEGHAGVRREAVGKARPDSMNEYQRMVVEATVNGLLESSCRSNLYPKYAEPGSPWISWRSLARVDVDDAVWYVTALSCTDSLCSRPGEPPELTLHDRIALVAIGRDRSRVLLLPPEPATIGDEGSAVVDSADAIRGDGFTLVPVKRHIHSEHPCYDGGDYTAADQQFLLVLRGDSLAQAMMLTRREEWDSHDDVDGDLDTYRRSALSITAASIRMNYEVVERKFSPDGDQSKTRTRTTQRGTVRLDYDKRTGRFKRLQ